MWSAATVQAEVEAHRVLLGVNLDNAPVDRGAESDHVDLSQILAEHGHFVSHEASDGVQALLAVDKNVILWGALSPLSAGENECLGNLATLEQILHVGGLLLWRPNVSTLKVRVQIQPALFCVEADMLFNGTDSHRHLVGRRGELRNVRRLDLASSQLDFRVCGVHVDETAGGALYSNQTDEFLHC